MKRKKQFIIILCIFILYCIPVGVICVLSVIETKKYSQDIDFEFKEMAYGAIKPVIRMDMREYYLYNGSFVSGDEKTIEIPYNWTVCVDVNEEVFAETIIATSNKGDISAKIDGIISSIDYGDKVTIKIKDISNLLFECMVPKERIKYFDTNLVYDEMGNEVYVVKKSNIIEDGYIKVYLKMAETEYYYGEEVQDMPIYTGKVYRSALVVSSDCVYKKVGDSRYYVRQVSEQGIYLSENEVSIGYDDGQYICITGLNEGIYCDAGYKEVMESGENE